jgi:hypothetical protein
VLKRVKTANGYRWTWGGKFVSKAKATGLKARRNPGKAKAKKTTRRKTRVRAATPTTQRYVKSNPKRKRTTTKRKRTVSAATRQKISRALKRRKRGAKRNPPNTRLWQNLKKKKRSAAAKKGWETRKAKKGSKTVAKKKRKSTKRRRKTATTSRRKRMPLKTRKKISRSLKRLHRGSKKTTTRRRKTAATPKRRRRKTSARRGRIVRTLRLPAKAGSRKRRRYAVRKWKRGSNNRYSVTKRNAGLGDLGNLFKKVLPMYGGFVAARIIKGLADTHIVSKYIAPRLGTTPLWVQSAVAPALTLGLSVFLGPKMLKGKTGGAVLEGLQVGSLITLLDTVLKGTVGGSLPASISGAFGGYDDMGVMGYGYGAYMADPTGYSLPPAHGVGMGLDAHEAMALSEYVPDNGLGMSVDEALAGDEEAFFQTGGAGGSLFGTVFKH